MTDRTKTGEPTPPSDLIEPCPFCGGPGHLTRFDRPPRGRGWYVICHGDKYCPLFCSTPYSDLLTRAEAIERWNTRNPQAVYAVVRERIEWQPIESAPKDGTNIILASGEQTTFGKWLDNSKSQWPWQGWITPDGPWGEGAKKPITHWMPLPDPPSNKGLIHEN